MKIVSFQVNFPDLIVAQPCIRRKSLDVSAKI